MVLGGFRSFHVLVTTPFFLRTIRLRKLICQDCGPGIVALIDETSIKRIHIEEKILGHFLSICLRSQ